jgi:hypothetical protein
VAVGVGVGVASAVAEFGCGAGEPGTADREVAVAAGVLEDRGYSIYWRSPGDCILAVGAGVAVAYAGLAHSHPKS